MSGTGNWNPHDTVSFVTVPRLDRLPGRVARVCVSARPLFRPWLQAPQPVYYRKQSRYNHFVEAFRLLAASFLLLVLPGMAQAQEDEAIILVAHPMFRDLDYRQTVLLAAPAPNGGHVGLILNRPTRRSLGSLFPEHEPSRKVVEPVYYGGPFSRSALVALVKANAAPGAGSVQVMKNLYLAFRANTIDHVIESQPNDARYYVGYVGWRPGELKGEIERGLWSVINADPEVVFRKDTEGLWEEMLQQSRRIRAGADLPQAAALLARAFSNTILPPR
jgi:putative transcriptional regulator